MIYNFEDMAKKTLRGIVVSTKMKGSAVVEVTRKTAHPIYKKLIKRSKRYVVDANKQTVKDGDTVVIEETRKMAGKKHFTIKKGETSRQ